MGECSKFQKSWTFKIQILLYAYKMITISSLIGQLLKDELKKKSEKLLKSA